ncbi:MAG TPA: PLP-dependent cysteine synthase family protein [Thermoanaerobaculia bacterium]|jgi:cysteine synthase B|nr:PLP-dependent cysteine synthase family protein [Thermoanaerobaculia bacterium]
MPETSTAVLAPPGSSLTGPRRVLELIGNTPLVDLSELAGRTGVRLLAKAEQANPGGSVKDRAALAIILDAERRCRFAAPGPGAAGRRLLDATSGNTGIAYAMIGAVRRIPVTLCMPENASIERRKILLAYGAELHLTDPLAGSDGAIVEARRLAAAEPERYAYLDQYSNPENWGAHYRTTGPEIWAQTGGEITHFVTGLGTSGTFIGVGRFLRDTRPAVRLISVEPDSPFHGLEGMKHMASALVPGIYDPGLADAARELSTETAYAMVHRLARELGLRVGVSAGANVAAALQVANELPRGAAATIVTVLPDGADKYLSDRFWEEAPAP